MQIHSLGPASVGHWISLIQYPGYIENFDSYGLTIDQELSITHEKRYLSILLRGQEVKQGTVQLQEIRNDVNTCGAVTSNNVFGGI